MMLKVQVHAGSRYVMPVSESANYAGRAFNYRLHTVLQTRKRCVGSGDEEGTFSVLTRPALLRHFAGAGVGGVDVLEHDIV